MRKLLLSILLAGVAASPALAQDSGDHHDRGDRGQHEQAQSDRQQVREERQQAHEDRQQARQEVRSERFNGGAFNGGQQARPERAAPEVDMRQQQVQAEQRREFDRSRFQRGDNQPQQMQPPQQAFGRDYRRNGGGYTAVQPQQVQQAQRSGSWSRDRGSWSGNRDGDFRQRAADQQRVRDGSRWASGGWNRDWRNDRRYDWRNYRDRHRSSFHLGIYYDPFGYNYRPFDIGYRLAPNYFGQQYWIDPGMYQLPYPPPGTQWVRYWNDAVLVDMYSGEVVDVIRGFFW
jgi:Ni/Co efflux regulator RcnB